ncbi:MAG: glycoside hydrolase [Ferruginibacter sp.]
MIHLRLVARCFFVSFFFFPATAQEPEEITVRFDENKTYQTIQNFAASDAWSCQFVGNWPSKKKNAIADLLFSLDTFPNGNPKGIGLSMWRYNLGAGSSEQGAGSGIRDEWRRAPSIQGNSKRVAAQNWFLRAAKKRGVEQFLGFFNSPPVQLTKNGRAYADSGNCNIDSLNYGRFADYTVSAIRQIKDVTAILLDYISPVNEPQWDWSDGGQEGCPYNNREISGLVKVLNKAFQREGLTTKLLITESGQLNYLLTATDKHEKDNQVDDFFNIASPLYVGDLPFVSRTIAAHSYFTTSPISSAIAIRTKINDSISQIKDLGFWQSEYCILGDNAGEINGKKKDLGIGAALYVAKVIYEDLSAANAAAWQWWTAISAYDYKDGLIYVEKKENDGGFSDSKMLWALGNYSRFVRPGMQRIALKMPTVRDLYLSAYMDTRIKQLVCVLVNESAHKKTVRFEKTKNAGGFNNITFYVTDAFTNLAKNEVRGGKIMVPAKSIVTAILK